MIYYDKTLYKELFELLKKISNEAECPFCGNDLRERYDCEGCYIDHLGGECFREGKHEDNCLLRKHFALIEIDLSKE